MFDGTAIFLRDEVVVKFEVDGIRFASCRFASVRSRTEWWRRALLINPWSTATAMTPALTPCLQRRDPPDSADSLCVNNLDVVPIGLLTQCMCALCARLSSSVLWFADCVQESAEGGA